MKKICYTIAALVSSVALVSCQKEITDTSAQNGVVPFELNASISETKTTMDDSWGVEWVEGDVVYAVTTDEEWGEAYVSETESKIESIAEYTYSSGKFTTEKTISSGEHVFNFLYTRDDQKTYHRGATTSLVLPSVQEIDLDSPRENLKLYDALAGQATVETPSASPVEVSMNHVFSMMKVTLTNNTGSDVSVKYFDFKVPGKDMTGIFNISFTDSKCGISSTKKSYGDYVRVEATDNQVISTGSSKDVYYMLPPFSDFTGDVEMVVTTADDLTYTKTITVTNLSFTAGKYTRGSFILTASDSYPTFDTEADQYSEDFESGYTAATSYNNVEEKVDGPENMQWASYYGTVSTSSALDGKNSMQFRWYDSAKNRMGYARTLFAFSKVKTIRFDAAASNGLDVSLYYQTNGDWVLAQTYELTTSKTTYTYVASTVLENVKLKFMVSNSGDGADKSNVRVDNLIVSSDVILTPCSEPKITLNGAVATISCDTDGATIRYAINADPSESSTVYESPVTLNDGQTIKAVAYKEGMAPSTIASAKYVSVVEVVFDFTKVDMSKWVTTYSQRALEYDEATVTFASACKQSSTITNQPVTKGGDVTVVMKDGKKITSLTFTCAQWATKAQTITLHTSTDGGGTWKNTNVTSQSFSLSANNLENVNAVKFTFSSSSNQVGVTSLKIAYK